MSNNNEDSSSDTTSVSETPTISPLTLITYETYAATRSGRVPPSSFITHAKTLDVYTADKMSTLSWDHVVKSYYEKVIINNSKHRAAEFNEPIVFAKYAELCGRDDGISQANIDHIVNLVGGPNSKHTMARWYEILKPWRTDLIYEPINELQTCSHEHFISNYVKDLIYENIGHIDTKDFQRYCTENNISGNLLPGEWRTHHYNYIISNRTRRYF